MITDNTSVKGHYSLRVKDGQGNYKNLWQENAFGGFLLSLRLDIRTPLTGGFSTTYEKDNLVVNAGLAGIASRLNGDGAEAAFTYIALGTDTTAAAAANTALGTELAADGLSRAAATASRDTENVSNDTAKLVKTFSATGSHAIAEIGIFNAASAGTMLSRTIITTKNVANGDSLEVTYTIYSA